MHRVPHPTRVDVLAAIAECDQLGVDRFLAVNGYAPSTRYVLRHAGRSYPSKAIVGVASGLSPREFSGGAAHTCRVLRGLGFTVRTGRPRGIDPTMGQLARTVDDYAFTPPPAPDLPIEPVAYFASGSNHVGEIRAFADMGHDVGVCARELAPAAEAELAQLAGTDVQVFVDSGAFSEVRFDASGPRVVAPMTDADWDRVLALYARLGVVLRDQLHVVAPDRVGCQATTLARLRAYRQQLRDLHAIGVRILLPVQRGAISQVAFYWEAVSVLGFCPVPALPCKKAATTVEEAGVFARALDATLALHRDEHLVIHLLGLGARNRNAAAYLTAIRDAAPGALVQMDAVVLTALVGRANGPGGTPRRLTAAHDVAMRLADSYSAFSSATVRKYFGLVLALGGIGVLS